MTSRGTCPDACSLKWLGCYALYGMLGAHWRKVSAEGDEWPAFCADVAALPEGQLWRHNVAGDLPGAEGAIDADALRELVAANAGRRGFTFTHYEVEGIWNYTNACAIAAANRRGFTVNLSAETLEEADRLCDLNDAQPLGPICVLLPSDAPVRIKTPGGRRVVVCPAELHGHVTCASCQLCANPTRKSVVGFRAHGQARRIVDEVAEPRRLTVLA